MIKVFLFYQRLARKEKLLLLLAGSQALGERCQSRKGSARAGTIPANGDGAARCSARGGRRGAHPAPTRSAWAPAPRLELGGGKPALRPGFQHLGGT